MKGSTTDIIMFFGMAAIGVALLTMGIEGHCVKLGTLKIWERIPFTVGGLLITYPSLYTTIIGAAIGVFGIVIKMLRSRIIKPGTPVAALSWCAKVE